MHAIQDSAKHKTKKEREKTKKEREKTKISLPLIFFSKNRRTCWLYLDLDLISNDHQPFFMPPLAK
jgi:hypothetical protein